jgi:hypothetical protein
MHYGNVETGAADECSITFEIDGKQVIVKRNRLQVESSARE